MLSAPRTWGHQMISWELTRATGELSVVGDIIQSPGGWQHGMNTIQCGLHMFSRLTVPMRNNHQLLGTGISVDFLGAGIMAPAQ